MRHDGLSILKYAVRGSMQYAPKSSPRRRYNVMFRYRVGSLSRGDNSEATTASGIMSSCMELAAHHQ